MKGIKIFLKIILLFSFVSVFFHFYLSFFKQELCFWNKGVIFGLADFLNPYLLSFILLSFLAFMVLVLWRQYNRYWEIFVVLIISACSNILDRIVHGGVCDYIDIKIFFDFPIFNLNDIFISTALIIILLMVLYDSTSSKGGGE